MLQREIDPAQLADITKFETQLGRYLAGDLDDDVFRVFRLNNGIYGQRQGGHHQMVRVKIPYGRLTPEQLDLMGHLADTYSRGWGHITTRQNIQFHFVDLDTVPAVLRTLEVIVRVFSNQGSGDKKWGARMKGLVDAVGWDELEARILKERRFLRASSSGRGGTPEGVQKEGAAPAGLHATITPTAM